jgi:uncharacterized protein (TIGR00255 family)
MTGFGHAETERDGVLVTADVRSYNNRYLELSVMLPSHLSVLEPRVREMLAGCVERGKVEVVVRITEFAETGTIVVDEALARSYIQAMESLAYILGSGERPHLTHLARMEGIFLVRRRRDQDKVWEIVRVVLSEALAGFAETRSREGTYTEADLLRQIATVEAEIAHTETLAPLWETKIREGLRSRLQDLLGERYDEPRLIGETAQMLLRFDVNEELKRMGAHVDAFRAAVARGGACGRMLDFICQELHREINTLGSKSLLLEVDQSVLRMKDALEKIREQVRNVE